ncbi:hypothetical protein [Halomonas sp. BC2]|uniref:hypothetical protein n=1 Tax=Halomonas sp. BC2 TaxID=1670449 RepID=UPI001119D6B2|nr:hypothetical protein [Halomonas sp. BC2]
MKKLLKEWDFLLLEKHFVFKSNEKGISLDYLLFLSDTSQLDKLYAVLRKLAPQHLSGLIAGSSRSNLSGFLI